MLLFDAHLDLSYNALDYGRDLRKPVAKLREEEDGMSDRGGRGGGTVALPELRRGSVGVCVATLLAPCTRPENTVEGWDTPEEAWAQAKRQVEWYRQMENEGEMCVITNAAELRAQTNLWDNAADGSEDLPIGCILSLEGADPLVTVSDLEKLHAMGLRALGPAHYGAGRYANGTDATGKLNDEGRELVREMDRLGMILDATHLCDDSFWDAVDIFDGPIWASHSNCRNLVPHNRQFSDEQIKYLIDRGAVIGGVFDAWMLIPDWVRGKSTPKATGVSLEHVVQHIDHVCQLAGNASHSGIGSDLDGGFGNEQVPADVDTIADLQKLPELFRARGYSDDDITKIMHGNFLRFLDHAWQD